jgi:transposase
MRGSPSRKGCSHAEEVPPEFKRDVVAHEGQMVPLDEVAADFDISTSTLHRWMRRADVDDGIKDGLTSAEQAEIVQLQRDKRRLEMENEVLRRAAASFAETPSQNVLPAGPRAGL